MLLPLLSIGVGLSAVFTFTFQLSQRSDSDVAQNEPVPGNYSGPLRPQVHFSPPINFMNDPNGCFLDANGTWHLYYQYNPTDLVAGNQHWGHATSKDLYHWENQQIAIFPDNDTEQIFTGSAVIDVNNTSGFFPNQDNGVVAIYTVNNAVSETQDIAYSLDGGYTFTKFEGNPVISLDPPSTQFRDPKVIRHGDNWVMVVSYATDFTIGIFTSPDLKSWTHASNFSHHGLLGLQYECPNLVEIPFAHSSDSIYLLIVSINPGAPQGGSITQYFPGHFNGTHFEPVDGVARIADFGKDNYAGQFFYGSDSSSPVFIAWSSNWQYGQVVPTGTLEGWRSSMSLPRQISIANVTGTGWDLLSVPYNIPSIFLSQLGNSSNLGNGNLEVNYGSLPSGAVYFQVNVSNASGGGTLNFTFSSSKTRESVKGGFFFDGDFWLDRGGTTGFDNPFFTDKFSTSNPVVSGMFTLEVVIDRTILEVFLDYGRNSATTTFFPTSPLDTLVISTEGLGDAVEVSVVVWGLKDAWAAMTATDGIVHGNVTTPSE
ncbi:putative invertase 4 [Gymnopilus junonius]|uniref:Invertase 4 n=1 Tax=Gymnopilus junonius TaxID=109634 RepID=A0A9P5NTJ3_GYMJU|nr:putative invertase 4 [Gymnopilus junonius]